MDPNLFVRCLRDCVSSVTFQEYLDNKELALLNDLLNAIIDYCLKDPDCAILPF